MSARYQARRLGPATANIVDTDTGYHTVDLFVGDDAMAKAEDRADALSRADEDLDDERGARELAADRRYRDYLDGDDFQHQHDLIESGMTDTCDHGCKVFRCSCGESEVRHMVSYGCPIGRGDVAA